MTVTVKLSGFAELERELEQLEKLATRKAVARRALKKAAEPLAGIANSMAPVGATGDYARSFVYSTKLNKRQTGLHRKMFRNDRAAIEGFVGTNDPAGVQQEFGNLNHGPQPALRPAWQQDQNAMLERLKAELWADLQKTIARANARAARG